MNILYRTFKIGFFRSSLAYIPMAPEFESDSPEDLKDEKKIAEYLERVGKFSNEIKNALPKNTICIRYDFPLDYKTVEERDEYVKKISGISKRPGSTSKKAMSIFSRRIQLGLICRKARMKSLRQ
ncbi:MAG: hypothetical protein IKN34_04835 [Treponema sp.]|nr:hypothetical protein [Treponema sp.]